MFRSDRSLLAGMSTVALQAALSSAQTAYLTLSSGTNTASVSLASGEVTRTVTYRQTDLGSLAALIQLLQAQLGLVTRPRRALVPFG